MESIDIHEHGSIVIATINNTLRANALSVSVLEGLNDFVGRLETDAQIRVAILSGTGTRFFSSGADIEAWGDMAAAQFARDWIAPGHRLLDRLSRVSIPVIAAINGDVLGGGLELAAACDLRVAVPSARFSLPEATIGVTPGWSGLQRVLRLIPEPLLREMALTGCGLSTDRLHGVGFINEISADPLQRAIEIAETTLNLAPKSVAINKQVINAAAGEGREAAIDWMAGSLAASSSDRTEGVASFREKRPPRFKGE